MEILQAKKNFGPLKRGDKVIVLPEHKVFLSTIVCLPFFKPKMIMIELAGVILNRDAKRSDSTNRSFNSALRKFFDWEAVVDDSHIFLVDVRLLEIEQKT